MPAPTSAQFSYIIQIEIAHQPGMLGRVASAIGTAGGTIGEVDLVSVAGKTVVRDFIVETTGGAHRDAIVESIDAVEGARVLKTTDRTFQLHEGGKIELRNKTALKTRDELSMAYTPGVARVCEAIHADPAKAYEYTIKHNSVAVVSDGTAVLGLGDIGPAAAMPVMEGKAMLFKEFGGIDAFPLCLDSKDVDEIVQAVKLLSPTFGGINLEDIAAPRCFDIEERLQAELEIPVFHDDQHGTAVVVTAALLNAVKVIDKRIEDLHVLVVGLGAAGVAVTKMLLNAGVTSIVGCDSKGALHTQREDYLAGELHRVKRWYAEHTNPEHLSGRPADVIAGADLFIGLSGARVMPAEALARMNRDAMVFAMANPNPEVTPEEAAPYVRIMATGRSDYPNQINNVLCFPGIFRGALDARARRITEEMKMAAARGIAAIIPEDELREDNIIPSVFDLDVAAAVAAAVADEAQASAVATASA